MHKYLLPLSSLLLLGSAAFAVTPNMEKASQTQASRWADSVYSTLSTRERFAQLICSKGLPRKDEKTLGELSRIFGQDKCGVMLFSAGTSMDNAVATNAIQNAASLPVLITLDGEWGLAMRMKDTPRFPHNMALGAIRDSRLLYEYGREVARECKLMGIHVNFAPDADVNTNPDNPVIGYRAFGEDPKRVAEATVAYSRGLEDGGVQAVAKHFPGHGDTNADSHKALVTVNHDKKKLAATDLVPFRSYINNGFSGMMIGHIRVPALDASGTPASMSPQITTDLLRKQYGFEGLVYTDALGMKGAVHPSGKNSCVAALQAGADVLLCPGDNSKAIDTLMMEYSKGNISEAMLQEHCKRVLRYKYILCRDGKQVSTDSLALNRQLNTPEAEALIQRLANASITLIRNYRNILPLNFPETQSVATVNFGEKAPNSFTATCAHYTATQNFFPEGELSAENMRDINRASIILATVYDDSEASVKAFGNLVKVARKPIVAVFLVNPYKMAKYSQSLKKVNAILMAYDNIPAEQKAAAQAIFGGIDVDGRMPVKIKGLASLGQGLKIKKNKLGFSTPLREGMSAAMTDTIDAIVNRALLNQAMPGCQVLVAKNGNIVYSKSFGNLSIDSLAAPVNQLTAYDLASVSKATGTLSGIMKTYDSHRLHMKDKLGTLIPEITDSAKRNITVQELLFHETGMPAGLSMFMMLKDGKLRTDLTSPVPTAQFPIKIAENIYIGEHTRDSIMNRIYNIPLRADKSYNYSCLNFCLLKQIEENVNHIAHDKYVHDNIFAPLGAYRTAYRAAETLGKDNVAYTEYDDLLRKQTMHGYVHDELACFSGGVQGNAGLFSNAEDLAKLCQMWLNGGTYGNKRILSQETVDLFTLAKSPTCRRGLGFDKPDKVNPDNSPTCEEAPGSVYGHLGFTGTVFWVDPNQDLIFIFLTNRVNPTRNNKAFNRANLRPELFRTVLKAAQNKL